MTPAAGTVADTPQNRALVIDDERAVRCVLRRWLERRGWVVDEAEDGAEALTLLGAQDVPRGRSYDLVIADIRMPRVDGVALHAWLLSNRPDLVSRLVISTGDAHADGAAEFLERAGCRLLDKPFELSTLASLLTPPVPASRLTA